MFHFCNTTNALRCNALMQQQVCIYLYRMPWEDPATAFRSAGHVIPPEIAAKKAAAAAAEAQYIADQAKVCMHQESP